MKEVRISVNGKFQFAVRVADDENMHNLASRTAEAMKIEAKHVWIAPGLMNLTTGP